MARDTSKPAGGARYEVLVGLSYPTDPAIIERIQSGAHVPLHERRMKRVEAGAVVSDIPGCSVGWLLEQGLIRPAGAAAKPVDLGPEPEPVPAADDSGDWMAGTEVNDA